MKRFLPFLFAALLAWPALAQIPGGVQQKGSVTTNHCVQWAGNGLISDAGTTCVTTFSNQSANTFFSGPASGAAAAPTFRAMVLADLPQLGADGIYLNATASSAIPASASFPSCPNGVVQYTRGGSPPLTCVSMSPSVFGSQSQNLVLASPSGSSGVPTIRALVAADLPATAVTPGSCGDTTHSCSITVDQQGRITAQSNNAISGGGFTGGTLTSALVLAANSSSLTPVSFQSGAVNTAAVAGGLEYDGTAFYSAIAASTRGYVPSKQHIMVQTSTGAIANSASPQQLFSSPTNGEVVLPNGLYMTDCQFSLAALSASAGTISFGFATGVSSGATFTQAIYLCGAKTNPASANSPQCGFLTASGVQVATSSTSNTTAFLKAHGILRVTSPGSIQPQITTSANTSSSTVSAGSYCEFTPISPTATGITTLGNFN